MGHLEGLCGNFDESNQNDIVDPNAVNLDLSPQEFGNSWSIRSSCPVGKSIIL